MAKPLSEYDVKQLGALFLNSKDDAAVVTAIEEELYTRSGPEAAALLNLVVKEAVKSVRAATPGLGEAVRMQLLGKVSTAEPVSAASMKPAQSGLAPQRPAAQPQSKEMEPAMALHEAERILGIRNDVPWQQVEAARVFKVSLSSPGATAHLPGPEVARRFADAKNANTAYAVLLRARGLAFS
ncbi:MAG: hypothetical protein O9337_11495 [Acidovorax sp.]|uniref:hypothetical protein n=1 Tax=Acidovorax sp. TaxID=1872122 RepID=UPI0022C9D52D|nr:hypothetical protein [Acidovorax sp.]MCZ8220036.1 hypothetical protein [Acidovorax sp.]